MKTPETAYKMAVFCLYKNQIIGGKPMKRKLNYDILDIDGEQAYIWTNDFNLIDFLDYEEINPTGDYFKNNQLVARSYRINKDYLSSLQKNYSKVY